MNSLSTRISAVLTFQAEDEIAAITSSIGRPPIPARWPSPRLSGPGMALKTEALGLAVNDRIAPHSLRHSGAVGLPPDCRRRPSRARFCCKRCSAAIQKLRFPCWPPSHAPAIVSGTALEASRIALKYMVAGHHSVRRLSREMVRSPGASPTAEGNPSHPREI